jgi:hypothetical protein
MLAKKWLEFPVAWNFGRLESFMLETSGRQGRSTRVIFDPMVARRRNDPEMPRREVPRVSLDFMLI